LIMGRGWLLTVQVSRVDSASISAIVLSLCFLVIPPCTAEGRAEAGLWQFEVRYEFVVSAQPRQPYIQGCFFLCCHAFNFGGVIAGSIDCSVDSWHVVERWKVVLY